MKKILLIISLLSCCFIKQINAQTPVPEDYFDLYEVDDEDDEDNENKQEQNTNNFNLTNIQKLLNETGAIGAFPSSAISSFRMVNDDCERTYICTINTLIKVFRIAEYELLLKQADLSCEDRKKLLQNYLLYLPTLNLDTYCIEHLHPDSNELMDAELINVMLAMRDVYFDYIDEDYTYGEESLPMLYSYRQIRTKADPFCSENLFEINDSTGRKPCDCGEYDGILDSEEKFKLLTDIRLMIDGINPLWQSQKAIEINGRLKAVPCNN